LTLKQFHIMKNKYILQLISLVIITSGCAITVPRYLPKVEKIDVETFGSYIELNLKDRDFIYGELLSVDSSNIIVLTKYEDVAFKVETVPLYKVKRYTLWYAQGKDYRWALVPGVLSPLLVFNVIWIGCIINAADNAFIYNQRGLDIDELKMFARFPQGIPPNIKLESIR